MKNKFAVSMLSAALMLGAVGASAQAVPVEVKGMRIGMSKDEVTEKLGSLSPRGLTIGGVPSYFAFQTRLPIDPGVQMEFDNEKLDRFVFLFNARSFDELRLSFKEKYLEMRCESSRVQTQSGANFEQTSCFVEDSVSRLTLNRYAGAVDTGGLVMSSKTRIQRDTDEKAKKRKEI